MSAKSIRLRFEPVALSHYGYPPTSVLNCSPVSRRAMASNSAFRSVGGTVSILPFRLAHFGRTLCPSDWTTDLPAAGRGRAGYGCRRPRRRPADLAWRSADGYEHLVVAQPGFSFQQQSEPFSGDRSLRPRRLLRCRKGLAMPSRPSALRRLRIEWVSKGWSPNCGSAVRGYSHAGPARCPRTAEKRRADHDSSQGPT